MDRDLLWTCVTVGGILGAISGHYIAAYHEYSTGNHSWIYPLVTTMGYTAAGVLLGVEGPMGAVTVPLITIANRYGWKDAHDVLEKSDAFLNKIESSHQS